MSNDVDPILLWDRSLEGKKSLPVQTFDDELKKLHVRMTNTMSYYGGIGIAAPQINVFLRVALISFEGTRIFMCNPEIVDPKGYSTLKEGCLSLPGSTAHGRRIQNQAKVTRCGELTLKWRDINGALQEQFFRGFLAHAIQHEYDHIQGTFFMERTGDLSRRLVLEKLENFKRSCVKQ